MIKPNIFTRFFSFLKGWYELAFQKFETEGYAGVVLTNWIKDQLDEGYLENLARLTPTPYDDDLILKAKANLPALFEAYAKAHSLAIEGKTKRELMLTVAEYVYSLGSKRSFLVEISTDIIVYLADGQISWNEGLIIGQKLFWQFFNKKRKLG